MSTPKRKAPPKKKEPSAKPRSPRTAPHEPPTGWRPPEIRKDQLELPEIYYDEGAKDYWIRFSPDGEFIRFTESSIKVELKGYGLCSDREDGQNSEVEEELRQIRRNFVRWAGALAGHWAGRYHINGNSILVTTNPTIIEANPDFRDDTIHAYFERLLGEEQAIYFHIWIKLARQALLAKSLRRGPAVILVGKADHGKSLGAKLVNKMLGGRQADPSQWALGGTSFNAHLFGNEFLLADDKGGGHTDYKAQLNTATVIKTLVADKTPECHGKHKTQISLDVFWRVMYALNDEPDDLRVLPALSDGIMDKLMIFRTVKRAIDAPTDTEEQYKAYEARLKHALPDYLGWLEQWEIPDEYLGGRFGQKVYHNPSVLTDLQSLAPSSKLLNLIDQCGEELYKQKLEAKDFEAIIRAYNEQEARELFRRPGNCGTYLARLCREQSNRVIDAGRYAGGSRRYLVHPPSKDASE